MLRRPARTTALLAAVTAAAVGSAIAIAMPATAAPPVEATRSAYADAEISSEVVVVPMVFPVIGGVSWSDTYLACRSGCARKHFGQDLMSPRMRPLVATFNGVISSLKRETTVGEGNYLTVEGDNGWSANYLHMNNDTPGTDDGRGTAAYAFAPGIRQGLRVVQGQLLGWSGDSGNAEGTGPHTHFELRKGSAWSGVVYNPAASLRSAWRLSRPTTSGPHPDGVLIRDRRWGPAYLVEDGDLRRFATSTLVLNGYRTNDVVAVEPAELAMYGRGPDMPIRDGVVVRGPDGAHWVIEHGQRVRVPDDALASVGVHPSRVRVADAEALARTPIADDQTLPGPVRDGALLRLEGASTLWLIQDGKRRPVPDIPTLNSWGVAHQDAWTLPADAWGAPPSPTPSADPSASPSAVQTPLPVVPLQHRRTPSPVAWPTVGPSGEPTAQPSAQPSGEPEPTGPRVGAVLLPREGSLLREPTGVTWLVSGGQRRLIPSSAVIHAYAMGAITKRTAWASTVERIDRGRDFP